MHGASSSINKNVVSHEAHWFINVYDLLLKLVKKHTLGKQQLLESTNKTPETTKQTI
jgi:hypothetical protein